MVREKSTGAVVGRRKDTKWVAILIAAICLIVALSVPSFAKKDGISNDTEQRRVCRMRPNGSWFCWWI